MKYAVTFSFKSWDNERVLITTDVFNNLDEVSEVLHSIDVASNYTLVSVVAFED